jgi:hypothetical protein
VTKQATEVKVAKEATVMTWSDGASGGGPRTVQGDARKAPDMTLDPKAMGKRPAATTGSGGSSPPRPASAFVMPGGMLHTFFCRFFLFLPILCVTPNF